MCGCVWRVSHEMCLGRLATTTLTVHSHISRRGRGTEDVHLHMQANLANCCCCCCCGVCGWTAQCHPCCLCHPGVWRHQRHRPGSEFPLQLPASSHGSRSHRGRGLWDGRKRDMVGGGGWDVLLGGTGGSLSSSVAAGLLLCWGHLCCGAPAAPLLALLCCHPVCMAAQPTLLQLLVRP